MDSRPASETASRTLSYPQKQIHSVFDDGTAPRLGISAPIRIPMSMCSAFGVGITLGASHGSSTAALRYRAENAHRLPTSTVGWYQYHRSKNYKAIVGGVRDGLKLGSKLSAGVLAFCFFEETVDRARHGNRDFLSTVTAGLSFSGVYSLFGVFIL